MPQACNQSRDFKIPNPRVSCAEMQPMQPPKQGYGYTSFCDTHSKQHIERY